MTRKFKDVPPFFSVPRFAKVLVDLDQDFECFPNSSMERSSPRTIASFCLLSNAYSTARSDKKRPATGLRGDTVTLIGTTSDEGQGSSVKDASRNDDISSRSCWMANEHWSHPAECCSHRASDPLSAARTDSHPVVHISSRLTFPFATTQCTGGFQQRRQSAPHRGSHVKQIHFGRIDIHPQHFGDF